MNDNIDKAESTLSTKVFQESEEENESFPAKYSESSTTKADERFEETETEDEKLKTPNLDEVNKEKYPNLSNNQSGSSKKKFRKKSSWEKGMPEPKKDNPKSTSDQETKKLKQFRNLCLSGQIGDNKSLRLEAWKNLLGVQNVDYSKFINKEGKKFKTLFLKTNNLL